jgi:Cu+-exporting ATPase
VAPEALVDAVEAAGYQTALPATGAARADEHDETESLRRRAIFAAVLSVPVLALAMIPPLQFDNFQWLSLNLVTPVVLWAAWPFHKAAWANLRHGAATMDTLISVGVLAAWLWSLYALFLGDAGMNDMRMSFSSPAPARPPNRSTWRPPASSPPSCWPGATSRPGPGAAPAPP